MPHSIDSRFCRPPWRIPGVIAFTTTRQGGRSQSPWNSLNLGSHVGDAASAVAANRARLLAMLPQGSALQWLNQVHGTEVVEASGGPALEADACWTQSHGVACAVMTADCLPVLFADEKGARVAAAHAGWRGLQAGILEATVAAMEVAPERLQAWLGPAIGPGAFEVGPEVRDAFMSVQPAKHAFKPAARPGHYLADLYQLARERLTDLGLAGVSGGGYCTFDQSDRFFSFRRDGQTGRMASVILLSPS